MINDRFKLFWISVHSLEFFEPVIWPISDSTQLKYFGLQKKVQFLFRMSHFDPNRSRRFLRTFWISQDDFEISLLSDIECWLTSKTMSVWPCLTIHIHFSNLRKINSVKNDFWSQLTLNLSNRQIKIIEKNRLISLLTMITKIFGTTYFRTQLIFVQT